MYSPRASPVGRRKSIDRRTAGHARTQQWTQRTGHTYSAPRHARPRLRGARPPSSKLQAPGPGPGPRRTLSDRNVGSPAVSRKQGQDRGPASALSYDDDDESPAARHTQPCRCTYAAYDIRVHIATAYIDFQARTRTSTRAPGGPRTFRLLEGSCATCDVQCAMCRAHRGPLTTRKPPKSQP